MDALIVGGTSPIRITSLTRSDVFGTHAGMWFMTALQMQPIYRMRDGYEKMAKNEEVFENVRDKLRANEGVLIFSEGNHGNEYFLRPLSKGSSRMALESQEKMPEKDVYVVPVGMNYFHHQRPFHKLSVVFGDPIKVKDYFDLYKEHPAKGANQLKNTIAEEMKKCLLIPEETEDYEEKRKKINRRNESNSFQEFRTKMEEGTLKDPKPGNRFLALLGRLFGIFNFLPLLIIQLALKPVKDIVFYGSFKWVSALFLFPVWYLGILLGVGLIYGYKIAFLVVIGLFTALLIRQWLIKLSNVSH